MSRVTNAQVGALTSSSESCGEDTPDFIEISGNDGIWRTTAPPVRVGLPLVLNSRTNRLALRGLGWLFAAFMIFLAGTLGSMRGIWAGPLVQLLCFVVSLCLALASSRLLDRAFSSATGITLDRAGFSDAHRGVFLPWSAVQSAMLPSEGGRAVSLLLRRPLGSVHREAFGRADFALRRVIGFVAIDGDAFDVSPDVVERTANRLIELSAPEARLEQT